MEMAGRLYGNDYKSKKPALRRYLTGTPMCAGRIIIIRKWADQRE